MRVRLLADAEVQNGTDNLVWQVVGGDDDGAVGAYSRASITATSRRE
jgi:hypothetical protein